MRFRRLVPIVFVCAGCNAGASFALPETSDGGAVGAGGNTLEAGVLTATGAELGAPRRKTTPKRLGVDEPPSVELLPGDAVPGE